MDYLSVFLSIAKTKFTLSGLKVGKKVRKNVWELQGEAGKDKYRPEQHLRPMPDGGFSPSEMLLKLWPVTTEVQAAAASKEIGLRLGNSLVEYGRLQNPEKLGLGSLKATIVAAIYLTDNSPSRNMKGM